MAKKKIKKKTARKPITKLGKSMFNNFFKGVKIEVRKVKEKAEEQGEKTFEKIESIGEKILKVNTSTKISQILESYDKSNITIGVLGGHSALDVCRGAKKLGFRTVAVCQKGREQTYAKYYKTRDDGKGVIDEMDLRKKDRQTKKEIDASI